VIEIVLVVVLVFAAILFVILYDKVLKTANTNTELAKRIWAVEKENEQLQKHISELESESKTED